MVEYEFEVAGASYRANKLDPFKQLHLTRKIGPIVPKLFPLMMKLQKGVSEDLSEMVDAAGPLMEALAAMPEADVDFVVKTCMYGLKRKNSGVWSPILNENSIMFADFGLDSMLPIVVRVLRENLGNFIRAMFASEAAAQVLPSVA